MKAVIAMLTIAALFASSGGHVALPKGLVYLEDAGIYLNSTGGVYFVKAWRDGFQLIVLSKPIPVYTLVRVEGSHVNITLLAGGCRKVWFNQNATSHMEPVINASTSKTEIRVEPDTWRSLGISCRGGLEAIILIGPRENIVSTELTPVYTLSTSLNARSTQSADNLHNAAEVAAIASLAAAVVAWIVERRSGRGG